jgi:hypothetical protein
METGCRFCDHAAIERGTSIEHGKMRGMKSYLATPAAAMHATGARPTAAYLAGPFSMGYVVFLRS